MRVSRVVCLCFVVVGGIGSSMAAMDTDIKRTCVVDKGSKEFWFCGKHTRLCGTHLWQLHHRTNELKHGDKMRFRPGYSNPVRDDKTNFCCVNDDGTGRFVSQPYYTENGTYNTKDFDDYNTTSIVVNVLPGGGTCRYVRTVDMCGRVVQGVPCAVPDTCSADRFLRNGACVKPCETGTAFESEKSNNCIACETNATQGVGPDGICIKCNTPHELFNRAEQKCKSTTMLSKSAMQKCFRCANNEFFKQCVQKLSAPETPADNETWKSVKENCFLE